MNGPENKKWWRIWASLYAGSHVRNIEKSTGYFDLPIVPHRIGRAILGDNSFRKPSEREKNVLKKKKIRKLMFR